MYVEKLRADEVERGLHLRLIDELTFAGPAAMVERGHQRRRQKARCDGVGVRIERPCGRTVVPAGDLVEAAHRSGVVPVAGELGGRAGLAQQAGAGHDDARVEFAGYVVAETQFGHRASGE